MIFTQVELTCGDQKEVWWLPVPAGRAKTGEKITRNGVDWTITAVCISLREEHIPYGARLAKGFYREAQTIAYMSI